MAIQAAPNIPAARRANKAEAAAFFGVSLPTISDWINKGAPVLQKGNRGIPWVLDLLAMAEWRFTGATNDGGGPEAVDPDQLSPTDRLAWYRAEKERRAILKDERFLLEAPEVAEAIATAFAALAQENRAIPDRLERRHGVAPEIVEAVAEEIDGGLDAIADRLQELMGDGGGGD